MANNTATQPQIRTVFKYDETSKEFAPDKLWISVLIFFIISMISQSALILLNWSVLPPEVPLFYSRSWGELMLAKTVYLWILPAFTLIFTGVNYLISLYLKSKYYFLNRVLICFIALISFVSLYDLVRIVKLLV